MSTIKRFGAIELKYKQTKKIVTLSTEITNIPATMTDTTFITTSSTGHLYLPAPSAGLQFDFIYGYGDDQAHVINYSGNKMLGHFTNATSGNVYSNGYADNVYFYNANPGDKISIVSDGTNYYVNGSTSVHNAIGWND